MRKNTIHLVCPTCLTINRLPATKLGSGAKCGQCHRPLFTGQPVEFNSLSFEKHLRHNDIPLLIDFWAPWCGPCQLMGPAFASAAGQLEPRFRLGKINTEQERNIAAQLGIRGIPTMIIFHKGQEVARQSGALDSAGIVHWAQAQQL